MSVKERIKKFIKYKGIPVRKFESICGFSYGYIANIRVSIQPDKVMRIAEHFPELNTGWLLTGEGEMLKSEKKQIELQEPEKQCLNSDYKRLLNTIYGLSETLNRLSRENEQLRNELKEYKKGTFHQQDDSK
jgi:predicted RNase H-like nuclease (RuvC/YqgF family)